MNNSTARFILQFQDKQFRKANNWRFTVKDYEYRTVYCSGFAPSIEVFRRKADGRRRKFIYMGYAPIHDCLSVGQVMGKVANLVSETTGIPQDDIESAILK